MGKHKPSSSAPASTPAPAGPSAQPVYSLGPGWRGAISALIAFHVVALFVAPWSGPGPASRMSLAFREQFRWYNNATHTLKGYRFFAPAPGPSHLVDFELTFADGTMRKGRFPNLNEEFPRLYYHRHFMLAEFLNTLDVPPLLSENDRVAYRRFIAPLRMSGTLARLRTSGLPLPDEPAPTPTPVGQGEFEERIKLFDALWHDFAQHLLNKYQAQSIKLTLVEHRFPLPDQFQNGWKMDDQRLFDTQELGTYPSTDILPTPGSTPTK